MGPCSSWSLRELPTLRLAFLAQSRVPLADRRVSVYTIDETHVESAKLVVRSLKFHGSAHE